MSLYATPFAAMPSSYLLKREEGHEMNQGLRKRKEYQEPLLGKQR